MKRRKALKTVGLSSVGIGLLAGFHRQAVAQEQGSELATDTEEGLVDLLFVQEAKAVTFEEGQLTLKGLNSHTLFFPIDRTILPVI